MNINDMYEQLSFAEKLQLAMRPEVQRVKINSTIHLDGYVCEKKYEYAVQGKSGEYYVYLWKHMYGEVFYVGMGHGNRMTCKRRSHEFATHLDKGDVVVYRVLANVDQQTAREYERYITASFVQAGVKLVNRDNNPEKMSAENKKTCTDRESLQNAEWAKAVEDAVFKILLDSNFTARDIIAVQRFLSEYGDHYFSR